MEYIAIQILELVIQPNAGSHSLWQSFDDSMLAIVNPGCPIALQLLDCEVVTFPIQCWALTIR